jgi:hypothetical protein
MIHDIPVPPPGSSNACQSVVKVTERLMQSCRKANPGMANPRGSVDVAMTAKDFAQKGLAKVFSPKIDHCRSMALPTVPLSALTG